MSKIRVIRFCPEGCMGDLILPFTAGSWEVLWDSEIKEAGPDEEYRVTISEMDEKEFKALPEHQGW